MNPVTTAVQHAPFDLQIFNALHKTMVYVVPVPNDLDSLLKVLTFYITSSLALCNPHYHLNSLTMGKLVWDWMLSLIPTSFIWDWICLYKTSVLPVYLLMVFPYILQPSHHTHYQLVLQKDHTSHILECHFQPIRMWSIWMWASPSWQIKVCLNVPIGNTCFSQLHSLMWWSSLI